MSSACLALPPALFRPAVAITFDRLPPGLNNAYPTGNGGRRYKSDVLKAWQSYAIPVARNALQQVVWEPVPRTPWRVQAWLWCAEPWRSDLDGRAKALIDALAAALGVDDRYLVELHITKLCGPDAVQVHLAPWTEEIHAHAGIH